MNNSNAKYTRWEQEIIALAAVAQCASLVDKLATQGNCDDYEMAVCINPLLVTNPDTFADVYPNVVDLTRGLRAIETLFASEPGGQKSEVVRYTLGLLQLRNILMQHSEMLEKIGSRLTSIDPLPTAYERHSSVDNENIKQTQTIDQLANLYRDTISTLSYRIQVQGRSDYLKNEQIAKQIRALLLAGIRGAVLWHQVGGRRWRLLLYRGRILATAESIRKKLLN